MTETILRADGIFKTFFTTDPATQVLNGIDLLVGRAEFVAVMGASGSGKSTLLFTISGMDRATIGTVILDGHDLTSLDDNELARVRLTRMGFVFQQAHFLRNLNIRDNVLLPAIKAGIRDAQTRVDELLSRFGIAQVADHGITEVSGGQLQRASICRALASDPAIVFADEPTGALNSSMTAEVMDTLTEVHRGGTTVVMVTHDPACAARADRVVYLRDGLVVDELGLGTWTPEAAGTRETRLLGWLREHDF